MSTKFLFNVFKKEFICLFAISIILISCSDKNSYDSFFSNIINNDKTYTVINFNKTENKIYFEYEGKQITGIIKDNKISFNDERFSKNNTIVISDKKIYFSFLKDNIQYSTAGINKNNPNDLIGFEDSINETLTLRRHKLDNEYISKYLHDFSSNNTLKYTRLVNKKDEETSLRSGDLILVFNNYKDQIRKIRGASPNNLYEGYFTSILEQKKPFIISISYSDGIASGNRFNDVGFNRNQIGEAYHYANYRDEIKLKDYNFFYYNPQKAEVEAATYGYRIVYEKNNSGGWVNTHEGYYSFYANDWLDGIIFSKYLKNNIFPFLCDDIYEIGEIYSGSANWKTNAQELKNKICGVDFINQN